MDSLWQRIGRAARGPGTEAVAVIIAEPKHFDEEKEAAIKRAEKRKEKRKETEVKKAVAAEQRKRKRAEDPGEEVESGRASGSRLRPDQAVDITAGTSENGPSGAVAAAPVMSEYEKLRVEFKSSQAKAAKPGASKAKKVESGVLSPELDNVVNAATRSFRCYRIPVQAYYENDRAGKSIQQLAVAPRGN